MIHLGILDTPGCLGLTGSGDCIGPGQIIVVPGSYPGRPPTPPGLPGPPPGPGFLPVPIPSFVPTPAPKSPPGKPPPRPPPVAAPVPEPFSPGGQYENLGTLTEEQAQALAYADEVGAASAAAQEQFDKSLLAKLLDGTWLAAKLSPFFDLVNLATYSSDAGLPNESDVVAQQLATQQLIDLYGFPIPEYFNPTASNPSEPDTDPYAEPIPFWYNPIVLPDIEGLPEPAPARVLQPSDFPPGPMEEVTIRTSPVTTPSPLVGPGTFPTGIFPLGLPRAFPAVGTGPQPAPGSRVTPSPKARPSTPVGFPLPGLPSPLFTPVPSPDFKTQPFELPKGGTPADTNDCAPKKNKKDDKKKKKRKPRSVCHRGTYYELANGLRKFKKDVIPCR